MTKSAHTFLKTGQHIYNSTKINSVSRNCPHGAEKIKLYTKETKKILAIISLQKQQRLELCQRFQWGNSRGFSYPTGCFQSFQTILNSIEEKMLSFKFQLSTKIMVWGAISQRGAMPLCSLGGSINSVIFPMVYSLKRILLYIHPNRWRLQQDNARCHTFANTETWFR